MSEQNAAEFSREEVERMTETSKLVFNSLKRKDLKRPATLKWVFSDIRNYLAGMLRGITRDEALAQEVINVLFCKVYDEINSAQNEEVLFQVRSSETPTELKARIRALFDEKVKKRYQKVFDNNDDIHLDPESVNYVVTRLQGYCITNAERDVITEAFEVFIGPALRGGEGQFFTPRNVVKMMVEMINPSPGEYVIDPACGTGGFLIATLEHIWRKLESQAEQEKWSKQALTARKMEEAKRCFRGIEKDTFLAKVARAYTAILGGEMDVLCENSLEPLLNWSKESREKVELNSFDVLLTNPPHGSRIQMKGEKTLSQYDLAKVWKKDKLVKEWRSLHTIRRSVAPQILFIERCLQFLKQGGRMGIILPESLLGNPTYGFIPAYLRKEVRIVSVVSMPEELFQPYTHNKTCVLLLEKTLPNDDPVFMGVARWCGHNSRGGWIPYDDVPRIAIEFSRFQKSPDQFHRNSLSFARRLSEIDTEILIPKYYDPRIYEKIEQLKRTHELISIEQLVQDKILNISSGVEIGRLSYGTGDIPFVRTSDISNWELKIDPKQCVDEDTYLKNRDRAGVKESDILMVRDGTYLVGTSCIITKYDTKILFQSHINRLRILKPDALSPFLLFAILNSSIVREQINSRKFTQNIIDTIGNRIREILLPIPKDEKLKDKIIQETRTIVEKRAELRHKAELISAEVIGEEDADKAS